MIEIRKSLNPKPDGFKLSLKTILGVAKRQIDQCGRTGSEVMLNLGGFLTFYEPQKHPAW